MKGRYSIYPDPARVIAVLQGLDPHRQGIIPLLAVRGALPHVSREDLDRALLQLERDWVVDLNVAQAPLQLSPEARASAIYRKDRGLVAYVTLRQDPIAW